MNHFKSGHVFFFVFIVTSVVRLVTLLWNGLSILPQTPFSDENGYYLPSAQAILDTGIHFFSSPRALWNGPLNPLWIAFWQKNITAIKIANVLLLSFSTALCAAGLARSFNVRFAVLFASGMLLHPLTYDFVPTLLTEPLFCSFLLLSLGAVLCDTASSRQWVIAGFFLGVATLARPTTQFLPVIFILIGLFLWGKKKEKKFLALGFAALTVISPVLINNYITFNKKGLANGFGAVFYLGNDLRTDGDEPLYSGVDFDTYLYTAPYTHLDSEGDKALTKEATQRIKRHPLDSMNLILRKTFRYIFGGTNGYFFPYKDIVDVFKKASVRDSIRKTWWPILNSIVWIFCIIGFFNKCKTHPLLFGSCGIILLYFVLLHAITFPIPRLALPIFPFALLIGIVGYQADKKYITRVGFGCVVIILVGIFFLNSNANPSEVSERYITFFSKKVDGKIVKVNDLSKDRSGYIVKGADPFFSVIIPHLLLRRNQVVFYRINTDCPTEKFQTRQAQLFWQTAENPRFTEACSVQYPLRGSSALVVVRPALNPCWVGSLTELRIDLPSEFKGCRVSLQSIQVLE